MSADQKPTPKKRRWLKRIGIAFLILLLILAIFHRPIIFEGTRYFVVRAAKQQNLDLTYEIDGSIFSTLTISQLKAVPTEPGPIQRLEIGTVNLQYSLIGLIRQGLPALLKTVELKDVFVEITPGEPPPPEKDQQPQQFKFPALFPEILRLENINFLSHAPTGDTVLAGLYFTLLPDRPGALKIQTLDIPGVRRWTDISAATTFRDRNLLLTDLVLGPEIALKTFNLDASALEESRLGLALDGSFFGANTTLKATVADLNATNQISAQLDCVGLSFQSLSDYLNLHLPLTGTLTQLSLTFQGEPEKPAGWSGRVNLRLDQLVASSQKLGAITLDTTLADGRAQSAGKFTFDAKNGGQLTAQATLPEKLEGFVSTPAQGRLEITAPDLASLTAGAPQAIEGDAAIGVDFTLKDGQLTADATIKSDQLHAPDAELTKTQLALHAEKDLRAENPPFRTLSTTLKGTIAALKFQDYTADALTLAAQTREAEVELGELSLRKGPNSVKITGRYTLPEDMASWQKQPLDAGLLVDAPELQAFSVSGESLQGSLKVTGQAASRDGVYNGDFVITGREIAAAGLTVRTVDGKLNVADNQARLSDLNVVLDDKNSLQAQGDVQLAEPFGYHGSLKVNLTDLSAFSMLIKKPDGAPPLLEGSLVATWNGQGEIQAARHSGQAALDLTRGAFEDQQGLSAHLTASYDPESFTIPDLRAGSSLGSAEMVINWRDKRLAITNLAVRQQRLLVLSGSIEAPLDIAQAQNPELIFPSDQPLRIALRTDNLNLRTLFTQLGQTDPPVIGTVNLTINAEGPLNALNGNVALRATRLQSTAAEEFDPADVSLDATLRDRRLSLDGTVRQRLIQPLRITGNIPLDLVALKKAGSLDPNTPVNLQVSLPRSSLAFLSTLVPDIRQSRGTATVDVRINGTVGAPVMAGSVNADLSALRFADPSLPPIDNFTLGLNFTGNRVTIARCRGGIAGGTFNAGGGISFARLDNPVFDLRLGTVNALAMQNDDITVRFSSDLRVTGPLDAGTVSGNIFVTRSRFFKNIDILPIGLPGRPAPQPPEEPPVISFPAPPLANWKFDIAIRTQDPFLIQGNLANGRIILNLRVGGTGREPWMDGNVQIEQLTASLPFSRLEVVSSQIYFNRDRPFIPQLDIRGASTIRNYDVRVNVFGPLTAPQAVFSSDPPLPQSEIVSLIATGMTTTELTRDPNAIAGRAAILLFQKAYNAIFRRNRPPANDSFLSRIQFDIGMIDPKTGKQSTSVRIPLSDQFALVGGIDVGGNFRGQVKYLVRFK